MKELPWQFCGELPAQILDETKMPRDPKKAEQVDPLGTGESSKALCLDVSKPLGTHTESFQQKQHNSVYVALLPES